MSAEAEFRLLIANISPAIKRQMANRCSRATNALRQVTVETLSHQGSGRTYHVLGRTYTASAPGEPPAVRTGRFRSSWTPSSRILENSCVSRVESDLSVNGYVLGALLENGTSRMAARPYKQRIINEALPKIERIYREPYSL